VLLENKDPMTVEKITEVSGCNKIEITKALGILSNIGLVTKEKIEKTETHLFKVVKKVTALHLAYAAQFGIDLSIFDNYFKISQKEKDLALKMASSSEKIKEMTNSKKKPLLQKRNYLVMNKDDDIYENLVLLFESTNLSLYDYLEKLAVNDGYLKLLLDMHKQSEDSLVDYIVI
jgi:DNA-binding transcriptional regulator GbsR (MarR family)